ncbi:MAG: sigma-70 family RNA polymerase sigma factor [Planctomycetales bacterium]|nr:sigma-70 family RNA polymerase sigma factor [Planctomycetales bacterium]
MTASKPSYSSSIDLVARGDGQTEADQIARSLIADPFTRKVIHRRVNQLLRLAEFASDSEDDLTQEFLIRLTDAMKVHCESVGHRNPYIVSVVDRYSATLLEHRRASIRYSVDGVSLDQSVSEAELGPVLFADTLSQQDQKRRLQIRELEPREHSDLKSDLLAVIKKLSPSDQALLKLLRDQNVTDAAKTLGIPRSTLASRVENIAEILEAEGLREYLA